MRQMSCQENRLTVLTKKPALAILTACLLLVSFIGFLVISNFRSQIALRESALNRFRLDLEKRSASLGYFFSERKYDLNTLALSREINTYFTNKALGMSDSYGLRVNLFMIKRVLDKTMKQKKIQEDNIYERFVFLDSSGHPLVDTASVSSNYKAISWKAIQKTGERGPHVFLGDENTNPQTFVAAPCHYKGKIVGNVVGWLDRKTLFTHFVKFDETLGLSGSGLVDDFNQLLSPFEKSDQHFLSYLTPERIAGLTMTDFSFESVLSDGKKREMLIARLPIHNLDLSFVAWMPSEKIVGTLAPWHLIAGMGSLAVFVLAGLGLIIWFTAQNLILRVRFDESERQQDLLAAKNLRLKEEIQKRQQAEEELKAQRTLRMRSDRLRSLGEMAAGIAHELNQPLVGVRGFAELILHSMDNGLEISKDVIRSNTSTIVEQADRMVHIINHVRLFARDADSVETSIVDLNDVVRSGTSMLMAQFNSHGLLLKNDLSPHELPVKVNPYSVEEVIFNLLSNARHSLGKKKETAGDEYRPCVHVITRKIAANGRDVVTLKIADNGTGIPGHAAEKIFDPFFTTKDPDKGTGLGLSICKSIVESFQGQIQFDTAENEGTSFEIVFPKH
jgi:signal transduction histidine kinase